VTTVGRPPDCCADSCRSERCWQAVGRRKPSRRLAAGRDRHRLHIDDNFGEVQRVEPFDDHHHSRRLAWVRNELDDRHIGWETPSQAAVRFQAGLDAIDDDVVVATHGMVMTAWLVARGIVEPGQSAGACWIRLTFPALVTAQRANQPD